MKLRKPLSGQTIRQASPSASLTEDWVASLRTAGRACCCSAKPAVVAVVTVKDRAAPDKLLISDLLLCGHHYRLSRSVLAAMGATVIDAHGAMVTTNAWTPSDGTCATTRPIEVATTLTDDPTIG